MDADYEKKYFDYAKKNWWFVARRKFALQYVKQNISCKSKILDVGCSDGLLLLELFNNGYKKISGVDISKTAIARAKKLGLTNVFVRDGAKPGFSKNNFDLIIASDVLEHIKDDSRALDSWKRLLKKGGRAIVFVPAYEFLWSHADDVNHHHRRYTLSELRRLCRSNGLIIVHSSYWNTALFIPHAIITYLKNLLRIKEDNLTSSGKIINCILTKLLTFENWLVLKGVCLPFGISTVVIVEKR